MGRIDGEVFRNLRRRNQSRKDALPDAAVAPAVETIVDRRRRAVGHGHVLPPAAGLQHVEDAADHATVIDAPGTRLWKMT